MGALLYTRFFVFGDLGIISLTRRRLVCMPDIKSHSSAYNPSPDVLENMYHLPERHPMHALSNSKLHPLSSSTPSTLQNHKHTSPNNTPHNRKRQETRANLLC